MRALTLILAASVASWFAAAGPAYAQQRYQIDIRIIGTDDQVSRFRPRLETSIAEFVESLPQGTRNALGAHDFDDTPTGIRTHEDAREYWGAQDRILIIIWGEVTTRAELLRTFGDVYIGFSNGQRTLMHPTDGYSRVFGQVRTGGQNPQFELFQALVGYALIMRAWQLGLSREHINIIADRIDQIQISPVTASSARCLGAIRTAVWMARRKAPLQRLVPGRVANTPALRRPCAPV